MTTKVFTRKTFLLKMWEDYPRAWRFLINLGILLKYKTLNINKIPNRIVLPSNNILYVNSEENRGRALLISGGMTQKRLTQFWCRAVEVMRPDFTIDVGVNYGECIFSTNYPKHTKIYGIEANRALLPYIKKSKEAHLNKSQITIHHAFAADKDGEEKSFFVDKHWSGTSSASYVPAHNMVEKVQVKSITIDSIIREDVVDKTILFKVDVEGYEAFVLKGMQGLFEKSASMLGFIEFNSEYIQKTGISINDFISFLTSYFTIYIYNKNDQIVKVSHFSYEDLQNMFGSTYIHTDMILATDEKVIDSLDLPVD